MTLQFSRPTEQDNAAIQHLLKACPQEGMVTVAFEREPFFFAGTDIISSEPCLWVARDTDLPSTDNNIVAIYNYGPRRVYLNGNTSALRYASDLRIHPDYRNSTLLLRMYKKCKPDLHKDEWAQTVILADNQLSKLMLTGGRGGIPHYYPAGAMVNYYINHGRCALTTSRFRVALATKEDITAMQEFFDRHAPAFQGYPVYDFHQVGTNNPYYKDQKISDYYLAFDNNKLVGITGVWNQKGIKQTRVVNYTPLLKGLRFAFNAMAKLRGASQLPKPGDTLNYHALHCILVKDNNPDIFSSLLAHIVHDAGKNQRALMLGLMENSPLNQCLKKYRSHTTRSLHFLMGWTEDPSDQLDGREWYLEPARL